MSKKKNPEQEQEAPPEEVQEPEHPEQKEEIPTEENPDQQEQHQDQELEEQEEDPSDEEEEEDHQNPQAEPEQPPVQEPASDENAQLRSQLLQAQGKLAAYAAGVNPAMVEDAVTLAMAEAAKAGTITEASVTSAMDAVLKRHPEWKAEEGKKKGTGGFKVGADRDNGGTPKKPAVQNVKRWNRYK